MLYETRDDLVQSMAGLFLLIEQGKKLGVFTSFHLTADEDTDTPVFLAKFNNGDNIYRWMFNDQVAGGLFQQTIYDERMAFENALTGAIKRAEEPRVVVIYVPEGGFNDAGVLEQIINAFNDTPTPADPSETAVKGLLNKIYGRLGQGDCDDPGCAIHN